MQNTTLRQEFPSLDEIKGFIADDEKETLFQLGLESGPLGPCLEVGSYCGLSTVCLGLGIKKSQGILFSIDHHKGSEEHQLGEEYHDPDLFDPLRGRMDSFPEFEKNLVKADLEDTVVPILAKSRVAARMWSTPLALVFIDGGHSEEAALNDYRSWATMIKPGGILAIHDIFFDPEQGGQAPKKIYSLALASGLFKEIKLVNTLGLMRRISP